MKNPKIHYFAPNPMKFGGDDFFCNVWLSTWFLEQCFDIWWHFVIEVKSKDHEKIWNPQFCSNCNEIQYEWVFQPWGFQVCIHSKVVYRTIYQYIMALSRWNPKIMKKSKVHDFALISMKFGIDESFCHAYGF